MALTPEEAGKNNDTQIEKEVARLEKDIDGKLSARWHSGASLVEIPTPETKSEWSDEILAVLAAKYVASGWRIEKKHEPSSRWIFKKS